MRKIIILFLFSNFIWSQTTIQLLEKAKELYNRTTKRQTIEEIEKYKEIIEILKQAKDKVENPEIKKEIYQLLIETLDLQAEYKEKHQTMKEYAQLLYPEEKEKQAEYLKEYADQLRQKGEIPESISLYRFIIESYPESEIILEVFFQLGNIFERQGDWKNALNLYLKILEKDKKGILIEKAMLLIGKMYLQTNKNKEAIEIFQGFLSKFPESMYKEEVVYKIGVAYYNSGIRKEAKDTFSLYLREYPNGRYKGEVEFFLKFLEK